jgi:hypothetical protein
LVAFRWNYETILRNKAQQIEVFYL